MSASAGDILPDCERELARLRRSLGEFAQRHPKAASRLGISGERVVSVFARVLESLFVHYAPANSFVQLLLMSAQNGAELIKGRPLPGEEVLI